MNQTKQIDHTPVNETKQVNNASINENRTRKQLRLGLIPYFFPLSSISFFFFFSASPVHHLSSYFSLILPSLRSQSIKCSGHELPLRWLLSSSHFKSGVLSSPPPSIPSRSTFSLHFPFLPLFPSQDTNFYSPCCIASPRTFRKHRTLPWCSFSNTETFLVFHLYARQGCFHFHSNVLSYFSLTFVSTALTSPFYQVLIPL